TSRLEFCVSAGNSPASFPSSEVSDVLNAATSFVTNARASRLKLSKRESPSICGYSASTEYFLSLLFSLMTFGMTRTGALNASGCWVTLKSVDFEPSGFDHLPAISIRLESGESVAACHLPLNMPLCFPVSSDSVSARLPLASTVPFRAMSLPTRGERYVPVRRSPSSTRMISIERVLLMVRRKKNFWPVCAAPPPTVTSDCPEELFPFGCFDACLRQAPETTSAAAIIRPIVNLILMILILIARRIAPPSLFHL